MAIGAEASDRSDEPGELRQGRQIAWLAVRVTLLLVLLWGGLVVVLSTSPSPRTLPEFRAAVAGGRVSTVEYRASTGGADQGSQPVYGLEWSEGPLVWHRIDRSPIGDGATDYTVERFTRDTATVATRVYRHTDTTTRGAPHWPFDLPGRLGMWWVGVAWGATLLIMLGSTPRLGNRWAWLWMFTLGQVGAIAFLLFEPRPLWYRQGRYPPPRQRLKGGMGFLASFPLAFAGGLTGLAVGALARALLG